MAGFLTPVDIGNRALQHCGATQMDPTLGFNEQSTNAFEVSTCYDKLRTAELQCNTWRPAIREAVLRPVDTNTTLMQPTLWSSGTTYFRGSVVTDSNGTIWESNVPNNLGNDPLLTTQWGQYFGPLTVDLYNSSTTYSAGELVYTQAGDGTFKVYRSLANSNAVDPSLPNQWSMGTTYKTNDVVQLYPAWSNATTYNQGQGVLYTDGNIYASLTNSNLNNLPNVSAINWVLVPTLILQSVPVPSTTPIPPVQTSPVIEWASGTAYATGAVVMFDAVQYVSLLPNNAGNYPDVVSSTFWAAITGGTFYMSLINFNINNNPSTSSPPLWSGVTTYTAGTLVTGPDGTIYSSVADGNLNNNPTLTVGFWTSQGIKAPWTSTFVLGGGNSLWLLVGDSTLFPNGVNLVPFNIIYPIALGQMQSFARSVFRLPAGFLRTAPQEPDAGDYSYLGFPTNIQKPDFVFEGDLFRSRLTNPVNLRFVFDLTDVREMGAMLCEGIAARIGYEVCQRLTQSSEKKKEIISVYEEHIKKAVLNDSITQGSTQPPLDDWIATRY